MAKRHSSRERSSWLRDDYDPDACERESRLRTRARKTAQLCAQAERVLSGAFTETRIDDEFEGLALVEVRPNPDASRLLAIVSAPQGTDLQAATEFFAGMTGHFRAILARSISRKRVPTLTIAVVPKEDCHGD